MPTYPDLFVEYATGKKEHFSALQSSKFLTKRRFNSEVKHSIFLYYCVIRIASNQRILEAFFQYLNIES